MYSGILSVIAIIISSISLYFSWTKRKKEQPLLKHEVLGCKHKVSKNEKSTNLQIKFKIHNSGDRGTQLNQIEVCAIDFNGEEHHESKDLSGVKYLDGYDSTEDIDCFFFFSPIFQYTNAMTCKFKITHTTGEYSFECVSSVSKDCLSPAGVAVI